MNDIDIEEDLSDCPWFTGTGTCSYGCQTEPACQTMCPRDGWPTQRHPLVIAQADELVALRAKVKQLTDAIDNAYCGTCGRPAMFDAIETGRQWETIARQQEAYAGHEANCDIWDVDARGFCSCGYDRAEAAFRDVADRTPTPHHDGGVG